MKCIAPAGADRNHPVIVKTSMLCLTIGCDVGDSVTATTAPGVVFSYDPPSITMQHPNHGTTAGGVVMLLTGASFGTGAVVSMRQSGSYSSVPLPVQFQDHSSIVVTVPAGTGLDYDITVAVSTQVITLSRAWSYDPPELYGMVPKDRKSIALLPCTSHPCVQDWYGATAGLLEFTGRNFARDSGLDVATPPSVSVEGVRCTPTSNTSDTVSVSSGMYVVHVGAFVSSAKADASDCAPSSRASSSLASQAPLLPPCHDDWREARGYEQ